MKPDRVKKPSLLQRSWQLMIFDEYGRVIRINHLQRYMKTLGGAAVILFLAGLCFAILFVNERSTRKELQSSNEQVQEKVSTLMNENDALMARLEVLREKVPSDADNPV